MAMAGKMIIFWMSVFLVDGVDLKEVIGDGKILA
jgi:hypothetical protein